MLSAVVVLFMTLTTEVQLRKELKHHGESDSLTKTKHLEDGHTC